MKRGLAAAFMVVLGVCRAHAAAYDDFTLAVNANIRDDHKQAIAFFTAALKAGDLAPGYIPAAYRGRAVAYLEEDQCREAAADLDAYAKLKPLDRNAYVLRAGVKVCLKDMTGAQQDIEAGMGSFPNAMLYWRFGRVLWIKGMFAEAHPDFLRAAELVEKKRFKHAYYVVLWYAMTADRIGKLDIAKLSGFYDQLSGSDWPEVLLKLYLGKYKPEEVAAKAAHGSDAEIPGQKCEADFYTAEWYIARGNSEAAKPLISSAITHCPKGFIEYPAAVAEAERLGMATAKEQPK